MIPAPEPGNWVTVQPIPGIESRLRTELQRAAETVNPGPALALILSHISGQPQRNGGYKYQNTHAAKLHSAKDAKGNTECRKKSR